MHNILYKHIIQLNEKQKKTSKNIIVLTGGALFLPGLLPLPRGLLIFAQYHFFLTN